MKGGRAIVVYDGSCGVCQAFADALVRRDRLERRELVPFQTADLERLSPGLTEAMATRSMDILTERGLRYGGARAVFESLRRLPGPLGVLGRVMALAPLSLAAEPIYRLFAANRHRVSGLLGINASATTVTGRRTGKGRR